MYPCHVNFYTTDTEKNKYRKTSNKRPGGNKFQSALDPATIGGRRLLQVYN